MCLEEIRRCRPYFIGLLGERYGWVPDSIPIDLLESQEWLKQHPQQSVTELEILHGVFSQEPMHGHAYFYFRDPKYVESVPADQRKDFTAESPDTAAKLARLKQKIRGARDEHVCELREGYANPEQLGEWILEDFIKLIDRLYPKDQAPDSLDQEAARHEGYARSRRLAFVGREDLLCRLNEHAAASGKPIVLTGESGCGKSALLAEWVVRWRKDHPDDLIIQHYIGSTPDGADWQGLVRRILSELKRTFAIPDDVPIQSDALRGALNDWKVKAAGSRRVVLVLDALNQLADDGGARQLGWLPVVFPANFRVLVSTLPGESLDALRRRGWPELNVPLFARVDIPPAALAYFKIFSKTPPPDVVARLESTPTACNPLYLRAVLDELRQFGRHQELQDKAADYLSAPNLPELFDRILTRWHDDFGKDPDHPDLVRRSLCLIACARFGLAESELLDLLGNNGEPMPRRPWTPFYLAVENALAIRAGLLNFGHDYLRAAVRKRWLEDAQTVCALRLHLAEYFGKTAEPTDRKLDELPTLLRDLEEWEQLKGLLTDIPTFLHLRSAERWKWELHAFWIPLRQQYDVGEVYREALAAYKSPETSELDISHVLYETAIFHYEAGDYAFAEPLVRQRLSIEETWGPDDLEAANSLNSLAQVLQATNRIAEAEQLYRRVVAIFEKSLGGGGDRPQLATVLHNLAGLLVEASRLAEAEPLLLRALAIFERKYGSDHPDVARGLNSLAQLLRASNRLAEAEPLMRRALAIDEQNVGEANHNMANRLSILAGLLQKMDRPVEAEPLMRRAIDIAERSVGPDHPTTGACVSNLASLLYATGRLAEAEPLFRKTLAIDEQRLGPDHPEVAADLYNLANVLYAANHFTEIEQLVRRSLEIFVKSRKDSGVEHPALRTVVTFFLGCSIKRQIETPPNKVVLAVVKIFKSHGLMGLGIDILRDLGVPL